MLLHVFARFCNSDSYLALIICIAVAVVVGFCFVRRFIQLSHRGRSNAVGLMRAVVQSCESPFSIRESQRKNER